MSGEIRNGDQNNCGYLYRVSQYTLEENKFFSASIHFIFILGKERCKADKVRFYQETFPTITTI